jgi:hypothetical protein
MKKNTWMGQKVLFLTELFSKKYYWMQDGDGTIYLVKATFDEVSKQYLPDFT